MDGCPVSVAWPRSSRHRRATGPLAGSLMLFPVGYGTPQKTRSRVNLRLICPTKCLIFYNKYRSVGPATSPLIVFTGVDRPPENLISVEWPLRSQTGRPTPGLSPPPGRLRPAAWPPGGAANLVQLSRRQNPIVRIEN